MCQPSWLGDQSGHATVQENRGAGTLQLVVGGHDFSLGAAHNADAVAVDVDLDAVLRNIDYAYLRVMGWKRCKWLGHQLSSLGEGELIENLYWRTLPQRSKYGRVRLFDSTGWTTRRLPTNLAAGSTHSRAMGYNRHGYSMLPELALVNYRRTVTKHTPFG